MSEYNNIHPVSFEDFEHILASLPNTRGKKIYFFAPRAVTVSENPGEFVKKYRIVREDEYTLEVDVEFMETWELFTMKLSDSCARHMLRSMLTHWQQTSKLANEYRDNGSRELEVLYDGMTDALAWQIAELLTWCGAEADINTVRHYATDMLNGLDY